MQTDLLEIKSDKYFFIVTNRTGNGLNIDPYFIYIEKSNEIIILFILTKTFK